MTQRAAYRHKIIKEKKETKEIEAAIDMYKYLEADYKYMEHGGWSEP